MNAHGMKKLAEALQACTTVPEVILSSCFKHWMRTSTDLQGLAGCWASEGWVCQQGGSWPPVLAPAPVAHA